LKIAYKELDINEIENFQKDILNEIIRLDSEKLVLDFTDVENVDLCFLQTLISIKKYCDNSHINLIIENINSNTLKQYINVFNLNQTLGITND
jgi:anti-anti-sigma factor